MALAIYPLNLSPATLGQNYDTNAQPITAVGGVAPYTWSISGSLPVGLTFSASTASTAIIAGRPLVADQYQSSGDLAATLPPAFVPVLANPSTFTISVADSTPVTPLTATQAYTINVGVFSEDETISVFEMLSATYVGDYYIVLSDLGTRNVKIGDIGNAAFGGVRLVINAYLNSMTNGMLRRLRQYVTEWDRIKLIVQKQKAGSVDGVTGIFNDFQEKKMALLLLAKTCLPAYSRAEIEARQAHHGGSDFTGNITGNSNGSGFGTATLER
jgi:hypothetical protein